MVNIKKLSNLALSILMLASFSACGNNQTTTNDNASDSTTQTVETNNTDNTAILLRTRTAQVELSTLSWIRTLDLSAEPQRSNAWAWAWPSG